MTDSHLVSLNPEQRDAVEHGIAPLLIIAGAGTGKTKTLAHRVTHLIVQGVSRRAAEEMIRRVRAIASDVLPEKARLLVDALIWSGTFHAIGTRLLREYADLISLDRAFTIHDREDSADLMNLLRHDLGLAKIDRRFGISLGAPSGKANSKDCSPTMSRPSNGKTCSTMTIFSSAGRR
jgi:DNA helicase II / ATP-dependent DNA helicase PcrA